MKPGLRVIASGMCCSVGASARTARAAIRARLNRFVESEFLDEQSEPLIVARLPLGDVWGERRLVTILEAAVSDTLDGAPDFAPESTALLLLLAEQGTPGHDEPCARACMAAFERLTGAPVSAHSKLLPFGKAGLAVALREAHGLLTSKKARQVLVAGVDSYLDTRAISHLLRRNRLLTTEVSDGFIPGEGAGAVLLEAGSSKQKGLHVLGIGAAKEEATIHNEEPARALGLTGAVREALTESGYSLNDLHFRMTDLSGESFYFRDAAMAGTRLLDHRGGQFPLLHLTDCIGETGAAVGPLSLAYLMDAMERGYVPGTRCVLQLANDSGARGAVVIEHFRE